MKFYFAPMEGLTGYIYRNAHHRFFNHTDKYFSPFIIANQSDRFKTRELNDILPENNEGLRLIPQLLTNHAKDFIHTAEKLKEMGYKEINLNLGCPSGTVVAKNKGAGFLAQRAELDFFLEEIFSHQMTKISIKTRIGKDQPEEFEALLEIFNKYPLEELIVHPRVQKDFYKNKPNLEVFREAMDSSKNPVCYNGDLFTAGAFHKFRTDFSEVDRVMIGRGLLINPALTGELQNKIKLDKQRLRAFHDEIYVQYQEVLFGDRNILFKMKPLWTYMAVVFSNYEKYAKKIKKAERLRDYEEAVSALFREQNILESYEEHVIIKA